LTHYYEQNNISQPSKLFDAQTDNFYFAKDKSGRFISANTAFLNYFKIDKIDKFLELTDFDLFSEEHAQRFRKDDQEIMDSGLTFQNKLELIPSSAGDVNWFVTAKTTLKNNDGLIIGIEGLTRDIRQNQSNIAFFDEFNASIKFIHNNLSSHISIKNLADLSGMTFKTFERRFKKKFTVTPTNYIKRVRIEHACKLLSSNYPIQFVCFECGYCDQSYFTRVFKSMMRITPKRFQLKQLICS